MEFKYHYKVHFSIKKNLILALDVQLYKLKKVNLLQFTWQM